MALPASAGPLPPMHHNFTNLQADLFDLLASDTTNVSTERQSPRIRSTKLPTSPRSPNGWYGSITLPSPGTLTPVKISNHRPYQPPPAPSKPKHSSLSLPNSATSSPHFGNSSVLKKKPRHYESWTSPREGSDETPNFIAGRSAIVRDEKDLRRSKSCGDGRTSSPPLVDFAAVSDKLENMTRSASPEKLPEVGEEIGERTKEEFKCGALCLFLPGFGKAKPVRAKNKAEEDQSPPPGLTQNDMIISRSVSLEKFECGSWASSTIVTNNKEDGDISTNLYFDLPLELIRSSGNDADSPVTAAFIFDNKELRGVLKSSSSTRAGASARKLHESSSTRHVRFSTSTSPRSYPESPSSCITPRLRKAREDFNAFLEAQSA